jgi:hypothetical protein
MPMGLMMMKWDEKAGPEAIAVYPEELPIQSKSLLQIAAGHEYTSEAGIICLQSGYMNIVSYYMGNKTEIYANLFLSLDENPDDYEESLPDVARKLSECHSLKEIKEVLRDQYIRVCIFPNYTEEQKLCLILTDPIKFNILQRVRDEGSVLRSELIVWIKELYPSTAMDLESVIGTFIQYNLFKQASIKGAPSDIIFLIRDLTVMRAPPVNIIKDPEKAGIPDKSVRNYRHECRFFFEEYNITHEDSKKLAELLLDPIIYDLLKVLRTKSLTYFELEDFCNKKLVDVRNIKKKLIDNNIVIEIRDQKNEEHLALLSDILVKKIFPEYIVNLIRKDYKYKVKQSKILLEHLNLLEQVYQAK